MKPLRLNVFSEVAPIEQVLVHTPGAEMDLVAPQALSKLLFEDILFLSDARREHQIMCSVLEKVVGDTGSVIQISSLLSETFEKEDARNEFIDEICRVSIDLNLSAFQSDLKLLSPQELLRFALTGESPLNLKALPLPNLMFMRDVAAVVGNHAIISHPATAARAREGVIMHTVLKHHDAFKNYAKNLIKLPKGVTFEGGDFLVASDKVVLIGDSQRTSLGGIISIAETLLSETGYEHVILFNLPKERYCMHLDTVFTFMSETECMAFPPLVNLDGLNNTLSFSKDPNGDKLLTTTYKNLHSALDQTMDVDYTFAACGGPNLLNQQREQWTDGANLFALAPGVVLGYGRNSESFNELSRLGYRIVTAEGFLSYHAESIFEPGEKLAIRLEGSELSRGRGGPRCMTMPISRR
jgi:arginine deiminase